MASSRAPSVFVPNMDRQQYGGGLETADAERQRMEERIRYEERQRNAGSASLRGALHEYRAAALGQRPSAAEALLQRQTDQNVANQMAMAAQGRGGNLGAMSRQAASAGLGAQLAGQQQLAALRADEQATARAGYAGAAGQLAQQGLAGQALHEGNLQRMNLAEMDSAARLAIANAQIQQQHMADQRALDLQRRGQNMEMGTSIVNGVLGFLGGGTGAAGMAGMMSDKRAKKNIEDAGPKARAAVLALRPVRYKYKDGVDSFGQGQEVVGILAQDLEKTPLGKALVHETPNGKMVNIGGAASLALASAADHERRLAKMERRRAG